MKNKQIITIVIIVLVVLFIAEFGILFYKNNIDKTKDQATKIPNNFQNNIKQVSYCKNNQNCEDEDDMYTEIAYKGDIPVLNAEIDKMNKTTKKYYNKMISSNLNDESCADKRDTYLYSEGTHTYYEEYEDNEIINITAIRYAKNVCTRISKDLPVEVIVYDKKANKILDQKEFENKLNLTNSIIYNAITKSILKMNETNSTKNIIYDSYDDYSIFYTSKKELVVYYYQKDADAHFYAYLNNN